MFAPMRLNTGRSCAAELQMKAYTSRGFTLIELVVVITILGILAAFAIPKFVALDTQARVATISGLAGTVKSAAALGRSMAMATQSTTVVTMEGAQVTLLNDYPDATATGIAQAVNANITAGTGDFAFTAGNATKAATWTKNGAPTPANCSVAYTPAATNANGVVPPVVASTTTGC
jgi:MSHA pilin protein MshA